MVKESVREFLQDDMVVFNNPAFDNSIIGTTTDDRVVYSFEKMVEEFMHDCNVSQEEAIDFIEFNTIRAIPYAGEGAPVVCFGLDPEEL